MSGRGGEGLATGARTKKGTNFCPEEEEQCCRSFMHTSTDARRGIGQKNATFWIFVASHYARHKPAGGADRPARSLETKWSDIKTSVAKFVGCYCSIQDLDQSGKTEDDVVLDAMNLYKLKCGKPFVLKHCWLLLKSYPRFAAIFMAKRMGGGIDLPAPNPLPVDRRDQLSPNGEALPSQSSPPPAPAQIRPQGSKSAKADHLNVRVKEQALRDNAKATIDFAAATLKKAEQIAQQNTFSLFTLEDRLITCDLARQWLHLRRTQELAKLKAEVAADAAAEVATCNLPPPPLAGVCSSPANRTPSTSNPPSPAPALSPAPAPAPAPAPTPAPTATTTQHQAPTTTATQHQQQGFGFRVLNSDADADGDEDDCAELDLDDESQDIFTDPRYNVQELRDRRRTFGLDFAQAASDREDDTTIILDSQANPPPSQRRRLTIDPHEMHANHQQFWNSGIRDEYANRHIFSQHSHSPSPHNSYSIRSPWLQGGRV
jgi:hypothetical protein